MKHDKERIIEGEPREIGREKERVIERWRVGDERC